MPNLNSKYLLQRTGMRMPYERFRIKLRFCFFLLVLFTLFIIVRRPKGSNLKEIFKWVDKSGKLKWYHAFEML